MNWITPKNWQTGDKFNATDYNRIKNNLLYLHVKINELFPPEVAMPDFGADKTLVDYFFASEFNAFENELESLNNKAYSYDIGQKQVFYDLGKFISISELNRIENASLRLYQMINQINLSSPRTAFKGSDERFINLLRGEGIPIPKGKKTEWTGETITGEFYGYDPEIMSVSGNTTGANIGDYTVTFSLEDGYKWGDGTTEDKTAVWSITPVWVELPTIVSEYAYTGRQISVEMTYDTEKVTVSGDTSETAAGDYEVVFALNDTSHFKWVDGTIASITLEWSIVANLKTVTGEIISITDALALPADDLKAEIFCKQAGSGDPYGPGIGKNLIPYPYTDGMSKTHNGVTYTVNQDGSVTAIGTASAVSWFDLRRSKWVLNPDNYYVLNGDYDNDSTSPEKTSILFNMDINGEENSVWNRGSAYPQIFNTSGYDDHYIRNLRIRVASGVTVNQTFYPMIRNASISDDTYVPYSNIRPISGYDEIKVTRAGKNILPYPYAQSSWSSYGVTATVNTDGSITLNGTCSGGNPSFKLMQDVPLKVLFKPNVTYIFDAGNDNIAHSWQGFNMLLRVQNINDSEHWNINYADGNSFIIPEQFFDSSKYTFRIQLSVINGTEVNNETIYPMICIDSMPDTYEPYSGTIYTVSLSSAGTVYGGELDVTTGALTIDKGYAEFDGTENWTYQLEDGNHWAYVPVNGALYGDANNSLVACSHFKATIQGERYYGDGNCWISYSGSYCVFQSSGFNSVEDIKAWVADQYAAGTPLQCVYKLETPQTYTLTAQQIQLLLKNNTIYADCGEVTLRYYAEVHQ